MNKTISRFFYITHDWKLLRVEQDVNGIVTAVQYGRGKYGSGAPWSSGWDPSCKFSPDMTHYDLRYFKMDEPHMCVKAIARRDTVSTLGAGEVLLDNYIRSINTHNGSGASMYLVDGNVYTDSAYKDEFDRTHNGQLACGVCYVPYSALGKVDLAEVVSANSTAIAAVQESALESTEDDSDDSELSPTERTRLTVLATEVSALTRMAAANLCEVGKRLTEAKGLCPRGEWLHWLESVGYSDRNAQKLMQLAREYSEESDVPALPSSKLFELLALPADARDALVADGAVVDGEHKTVDEMTVRELREEIAEIKANAQNAEKLNKSLMEQQQRKLSELLDQQEELAEDKRQADERQKQLGREAENLRRRLSEAQDAAVQTVEVERVVPPADYDELKQDIEQRQDEIAKLYDMLDEQARQIGKLRDASDALDDLAQAQSAGAMPDADDFNGIVDSMLNQCGSMATNSSYYGLLEVSELSRYRYALRKLQTFCVAVIASMGGSPIVGGDNGGAGTTGLDD